MNSYFLPRQVRTAVAATILVTLTGCTNIKNDSDRTRAEGAVTGAAAGAAVGAGVGALAKKTAGGALAGAAAGAAVGTIAGAAVGDAQAKKKEGYAQKESALDSQLAGLNNQIEGRRTYNAKLRELVSAKEQQLAAVLASDRSAGPSVQEFDLRTSVASKIAETDRAERSWQETINAHKAVLKGASADARGPELDAEISRLAEERAELLRQRARLVSINEKLDKK